MIKRQHRVIADIKYIVVHHSGAPDPTSNHSSLAQHLFHTNLGYHGVVDDDAVFKSKAAGHDGKAIYKQMCPDNEVVWGAAGCNFNGWHVSIDGTSGIYGVTKDEIECLIQVIATKCKQFGWKKEYARKHIVTHQWVGLHLSTSKYKTECPGEPIIDQMPYIIERVCSYLPE